MSTEAINSAEKLLKPIDYKSAFQMAFQLNNMCADSAHEQPRSISRSSSSTHSSIIDPGDEKEPSEVSVEEKSFESPTKKLCTEYNRIKFEFSKEMDKDTSNASADSAAGDKCKPVRSFLIKDILSSESNPEQSPRTPVKSGGGGGGFIRPWDIDSTQHSYLNQLNMAQTLFQQLQYNAITSQLHPNQLSLFQSSYANALNSYRLVPNRRPRSADDDSRSERSESDSPGSPASTTAANAVSSPLDALFEMTSKAFDRNDSSDKSSDPSSDHLSLFNSRNNQIKKKRKSRTAFTNHQIFELERRFLRQKYLSPADRDEIAQSLGLTNAQVITWFQNRRAKMKRDQEEQKKDLDAAKITSVHNSLLEMSELPGGLIVAAALQQHAAAAQQQYHTQ